MGKASRRPHGHRSTLTRPEPAPFVARPFEGLAGETDWVALREIVPAATATVTFAAGRAPVRADGTTLEEVTIATVLPLAWPGLHRDTGEVLVGIQSGNAGGDLSRDLASAISAAAAAEPGTPVEVLPPATADAARLQDLLATDHAFEVQVHEGFDFWVAGSELAGEQQASLERANESVIPTVALSSAPSCYWCRIGDRDYVRWVLPQDEDTALTALARLHAAGQSALGGSDNGRLLGCFRSCGLIIPVWEVTHGTATADLEPAVAEMADRIATALAQTEPLTAAERGARAGLTNRQVTLR